MTSFSHDMEPLGIPERFAFQNGDAYSTCPSIVRIDTHHAQVHLTAARQLNRPALDGQAYRLEVRLGSGYKSPANLSGSSASVAARA